MPILHFSYANCSAQLEINAETERFTCAYCGTAQILERRGGAAFLKKVERAVSAVQRGTDRTAAELAMPRLIREREEILAQRSAALEAQTKILKKARNGRSNLTLIVFLVTFLSAH